jgi:hypothetical protein
MVLFQLCLAKVGALPAQAERLAVAQGEIKRQDRAA